jgi:tetratricopeptide (TPR) repeat protein
MTSGTAQAAAQWAQELEAELADSPHERGEILIEAGESWHQAGDHRRGISLLSEAITLGGEDAGNARVALAEVLFDLDRAEEAHTQLDALRAERPPSPMPYHLAAELLEDRGELEQALTWFTLAASRLTDDEIAGLHELGGPFSYANNVLAGRRRVRQALGLAGDDLDQTVRDPDPALLTELDKLTVGDAHRDRPPREVRVLFWPRSEIPKAHERWPELVEHTDADAIIGEREHANRELAAGGVPRITMVPLTAATLAEFAARTGGDPTDQRTRHACMTEIINDGATIGWPPGRNSACWCGSTIKYKKCCGRPTPP